MRAAIFADLAGHRDSFIWHAEKLGCEFYDGYTFVPEDLNLIFAGDLVHRGPHSLELLKLVGKLKEAYPKQIYILVGNHEGNYLPDNPHPFSWSGGLTQGGAAILQEWWYSGIMLPSVGVDSTMGPILVTHAGLTHNFWKFIGKPDTVQGAHAALLELKNSGRRELWNPGEMMGFDGKNVGPIWAASNGELYPSWLRADSVPFGQAHGHSSSYQWQRNAFFGQSRINPEISSRTILQKSKKISTITIGGKPFFSCDPDHGNKPVPNTDWEPLVLEKGRILTK